MIGTCARSAISRATCKSPSPYSPTIFPATNSLSPRITSRFSSTTLTVPDILDFAWAIGSTPGRGYGVACKKPKTRLRAGSTMNRLKPANDPAFELPASTIVVTPLRAHTGSGSSPILVAPQYRWVWKSISPGVTSLPDASITCCAWSAGISPSSAAIFPSARATSSTPRSPWPGSVTVPPLIKRSYFICPSLLKNCIFRQGPLLRIFRYGQTNLRIPRASSPPRIVSPSSR